MGNQTEPGSLSKHATPQPSQGQGGGVPSLLKSGSAGYAAVLLCGLLLAFLLGRATVRDSSRPLRQSRWDGAIAAKTGPWGEVERTPITIAARGEDLPAKLLESGGVTRWFFKDLSPDALAKLMQAMGVPDSLREQLLKPPVLSAGTNGVVLSPPCELLFSLDTEARRALYKVRAAPPQTGPDIFFLHSMPFDERFRDSGLSPETLARLKQLCCTEGDCEVFVGLPCLLATVPTNEEKVRLVKALTRQKTMLLRLHVSSGSDMDSLATYWGKACWNTDVRAILESLSRVSGGAYVDIIELLPPFPSSLLYTFPSPDNPLKGSVAARDCRWTSFNFFRDPPDDRYSDDAYVTESLKRDHYPVLSDPRFGDLVVFITSSGTLVHVAVFLADGVVYTKNSSNSLNPWMLETVAEVQKEYSFGLPPGESLTVGYFRNKYY